jgi:hypothetical protein
MRSQNETRGSRFRRASIAAAMMLGLSAGAARADLLAYWNFNTDNDPSGGVQSGTASLDFANISGPITSFGGSTINANGGDAAGSSLAWVRRAFMAVVA